MRKNFLTAIIAVFLSSCALTTTTMNVLQDETKFEPVNVDSIASYITSGEYKQRADNLFVLFDASASATGNYPGVGFKANNEPTRLETQREIVHRMNKTIAVSAPALKLRNVGLRSLGYGDCQGYGDRTTHLHLKNAENKKLPMIPYSQEAFDTAIDNIQCAHGRSYLAKALNKQDNVNPITKVLKSESTDIENQSVNEDLDYIVGNISLVIISDLSKSGITKLASDVLPEYFNPNLGTEEKNAVKALRQKYGNRLCIYNVWMNSANKSAEEPQSNESEDFSDLELTYSAENPRDCGGPGAYTAERVSETDGMKDFMRAVLLTKAPTPKTDCSQFDSDGDGVNDCDDKCPNTLPGTPVNKFGCWIVDIKFDNDKSVIKSKYFPLLDKLAVDIATHFPNTKIEIQGHTSSTASAAYNMRLSERRAKAVVDYLSKRLKGSHNLIPRGYGLTRPIDTNETAQGRANNRRVQLEILQ